MIFFLNFPNNRLKQAIEPKSVQSGVCGESIVEQFYGDMSQKNVNVLAQAPIFGWTTLAANK